MNNLTSSYFVVITLLISSFTHASQTANNFNLQKLSEGQYVHLGQQVSIEDEQRDDIANIGFIIGDDCIAVIDTGGSIKIGQQLLTKIRTISEKPICYVINTHVHFDHILGNKAFVEEETTFVGHRHLAAAVEQNREFFLQQFRDSLEPDANSDAIIGPDLLIQETMQIELGNHNLTLISYPISHSHSDLVVVDNSSKTLWAGDLIFRERIPSLTGSLKGWIGVMESLTQLEIEKVVPGHGTIADSIAEALHKQHRYLSKLLNETRKAIAEGQFLNDAIEQIDKENEFNLLQHSYQHPTNASRAYTELEWE